MTGPDAPPGYRRVDSPTFEFLPAHWDVRRGRHVVRIRTGSGDTVDADPDGDYPFYVRSDTALRSSRWEYDTTAVLTAGDGAGVGKVFHLVSGKFMAHQRVYVLDEFREVDPRFFFYAFGSLFRLMALDGSAKSTVDSVRKPMIADMPIPIPPPEEQLEIVAYLDEETSLIDELIAKQKQLVTVLKERKAALEWATFEDRSGTRLTTVKRVLTALERPAPPNLPVVTAYRDGTVTLRANRREEGYTFSMSEENYQEVRVGDLVFHALDGFAGAVGISDSRGVATPVYHVCEICSQDDPAYVARLLRHLGTSGFLATQAPNVRQRSVDFRNWQTFARVPVHLPEPADQKRRLDRLIEQEIYMKELIAKAERFIELSLERRSALVGAAVTGQIKLGVKAA